MYDDRYGFPGSNMIYRCGVCGQMATSPRLREHDLPTLYGTYYPRRLIDVAALGRDLGNPWTAVARVRRWIAGGNYQGQYYARTGMKVLDYGCGTGRTLLEMAQNGVEGYGIETDPNIAAVSSHYGLNVHIGSLRDEPFPNVRFDLIILNQVVEHIPDPGSLIAQLTGRLAPGGRMVISFPNSGSIYRRIFGRRWIHWHVPYHQHHFARRSFHRFIRPLGLVPVHWRSVTPTQWTQLQLRAMIFRTKPGVPSSVWIPQPKRSIESRHVLTTRVFDFVVRRLAPAILVPLNRVVDFLGFGDSLLVVLEPDTAGTR